MTAAAFATRMRSAYHFDCSGQSLPIAHGRINVWKSLRQV